MAVAGPSIVLPYKTEVVFGRFRRITGGDVLLWHREDGPEEAVKQFALDDCGAKSTWEHCCHTPEQIPQVVNDYRWADGPKVLGTYPDATAPNGRRALDIPEPNIVVVHPDADGLEPLFLALVLAGNGGKLRPNLWLSTEFDQNARTFQLLWGVATDRELERFIKATVFGPDSPYIAEPVKTQGAA